MFLESAILENISEKDVKYCMEFVKIISDTSLTKEQRVDKIEKAMLGDDVADDERKTAIEAIDLFIDLNDWILEQVATASFKVREAYHKMEDMWCDLLKMTPDERAKKVWQVFTTLNYDDIKEFVELIKGVAEQLGMYDLMMLEAKLMTASGKR